MNEAARLRRELRPPGPVAPSCHRCVFFDRCGGIQNGRPLLNCFDQFCCGHGNCDNVCPYKPDDFRRRMREVGGLRFDNIPPLHQDRLSLPIYVPMIHHPYRRSGVLQASHVALDPYRIFALRDGRYQPIGTGGGELRLRFKVAADSEIILRGTAEDRFLEQFWKYRKRDRIVDQINQLGVSLVIGPNYSHFLDVPRTDLLFNRKRQLVCLAELSQVGISVAPHLSAVMPADWEFWLGFLRSNPQVHHIALNFQTGYRNPSEGRKAIDGVQQIQETIGRGVSLILIGGAQFIEYLPGRVHEFTLIDSQPFSKSVRRKLFRPIGRRRRWDDSWTLDTQPIDHILQENITEYFRWVQDQAAPSSATMAGHLST